MAKCRSDGPPPGHPVHGRDGQSWRARWRTGLGGRGVTWFGRHPDTKARYETGAAVTPPLVEIAPARLVACHHPEDVTDGTGGVLDTREAILPEEAP